jgi:hypothetical protein
MISSTFTISVGTKDDAILLEFEFFCSRSLFSSGYLSVEYSSLVPRISPELVIIYNAKPRIISFFCSSTKLYFKRTNMSSRNSSMWKQEKHEAPSFKTYSKLMRDSLHNIDTRNHQLNICQVSLKDQSCSRIEDLSFLNTISLSTPTIRGFST